jgi:ketosteroid isomerase-like protein
MTDRGETEALLRGLYAARVRGDLGGVIAAFSPDAKFEIAGSSDTHSVSVIALGIDEFRPWLAAMIKTFTLTDHVILAMLIDGQNAAVHWRAKVRSHITGKTVMTEFVDLVSVENRCIVSYTELFVRR